jgi:hypothetical protein
LARPKRVDETAFKRSFSQLVRKLAPKRTREMCASSGKLLTVLFVLEQPLRQGAQLVPHNAGNFLVRYAGAVEAPVG